MQYAKFLQTTYHRNTFMTEAEPALLLGQYYLNIVCAASIILQFVPVIYLITDFICDGFYMPCRTRTYATMIPTSMPQRMLFISSSSPYKRKSLVFLANLEVILECACTLYS